MLQPALVPTNVLCLTQAVSPNELRDDDDYEEILDDMRQECGKFGKTLDNFCFIVFALVWSVIHALIFFVGSDFYMKK